MIRLANGVALCAVLTFTSLMNAAEPLSQAMDGAIERAEPKFKDLASTRCDDGTFLRRRFLTPGGWSACPGKIPMLPLG